MSSVVVARSLAKAYEVYDRPADRLIELLTLRQKHRKFPALNGVSFEIERGDSVGLIGQNGAGKSTLLKIISGVSRPTSGTLEVSGSVASILELGTGFHPEFTGKDNAALNAAILGLSPRQISRTLPRIFEFSELGAFLDRPVKTYSSGMYMRLAFSVAVSVEPELLIIDEALAVGDSYFQKKCVDRIREIQGSGRTILFCSHALYFVTTLCHRTLWLDEGRLIADGPSVDVVHSYETHLLEKNQIDASRQARANREDVEFLDVEVVDDQGHCTEEIDSGDPIIVRLRVNAARATQPARLELAVARAADETRCCAVHLPRRMEIEPGRAGQEFAVRLETLPLTRGDYGVILTAHGAADDSLLGRLELLPAFRVRGNRFEIGVLRLAHDWNAEIVS